MTDLSDEERSRLLRKLDRLLAKPCDREGRNACLEGFVRHQVRLGRAELFQGRLVGTGLESVAAMVENKVSADEALMADETRIRISLKNPPPGVALRLQSGKSDLVEPIRASAEEAAFECRLRLGAPLPDGSPRWLGPAAQGTPEDRFIYINSGTSAGQLGSPWTRRAKVKLAGISAEMVREAAEPGAWIEATIDGRSRDGGPACASVPLLAPGWRVVREG